MKITVPRHGAARPFIAQQEADGLLRLSDDTMGMVVSSGQLAYILQQIGPLRIATENPRGIAPESPLASAPKAEGRDA